MKSLVKTSTIGIAAMIWSLPQQLMAVNVQLPNPAPGTITNFIAVGGCSSFPLVGRVRGVTNDGSNQDRFDVEVTDSSNTVFHSVTLNQRVGSTNPLFGAGNVRLPLSPEPNFPLTLSVYENDGTSRGALLGSYQIARSDLSTCYATPLNSAPVADAGADIANAIPASMVTLDGTSSSDADNDALTYSWVQISGPAVTLDDATSPTPSFTAPGGATGTPIVFQLIVNDGTVSSVADTVTISVLDNIATAQAQIGTALVARNALLLGHQPDLQRRIDRLNGQTATGSASVAGLTIPSLSRLPFSISAQPGLVSASTSLDSARNLQGDSGAKMWDVWAEAYFLDHRFGARDGDETIVYGGVDVSMTPDLLVGVMGQYDAFDSDAALSTGVLDGEGWMVGPYLTARLAPRLYADARAAWGRSGNSISPFGTYTDRFNTDRVLLSATLTGEIEPVANLVIRPEAAVRWISDRQHTYVDTPGSTIPAQTYELGQISLAPRVMYAFETDNGSKIRPFAEARTVYTFGDRLGVLTSRTHARFEGGLDILTTAGLRLSASGFVDGVGDSLWRSSGGHLGIALSF